MILDSLTADQQIQIMSVQHWGGETAIQWALRYRGLTDTMRIHREYLQHAVVKLMRENKGKFAFPQYLNE